MSKNDKLFAIVDIETTGGFARGNAITEIAIILHDGKNIVDEYVTLINPGQFIQLKIQQLTGITNEMVADSPYFEEVADEIYSKLKGNIFVAHNVNFDFSFVYNQLSYFGFDFNPPKLCTVRLSRKIFPGKPSYSLGKLCQSLKIDNYARHRAYGDALATAKLFTLLVENDNNQLINNL